MSIYFARTVFIFDLLKTAAVVASRHNVGPLRAVHFFAVKKKEKEKKAEFTYSMLQISTKCYA
jgi:hypothetical protein